MTVIRGRGLGLTSLMRIEACLAAWKNGVSHVYLKLLLFFSNDDLYSLCKAHQTVKILCNLSLSAWTDSVKYSELNVPTSLYRDLFLSAITRSGVSHTKQPRPFSHSRSSLYLTYREIPGIFIKVCALLKSNCCHQNTSQCLAAALTLLTLSLTILLKKNSGRSGMDFHVPRELMYFSLYLTWREGTQLEFDSNVIWCGK